MVMQRDRMASDKAAIERLKFGLSPEPTAIEKEIINRRQPYQEEVKDIHQRYLDGNIGIGQAIEETTQVLDNVNHPPHYNNSPAKCDCGRRIECIDVTRHHTFNIGNAIKYLWRCDLKGNTIEDLKKAIWYIEDEIKSRSK